MLGEKKHGPTKTETYIIINFLTQKLPSEKLHHNFNPEVGFDLRNYCDYLCQMPINLPFNPQ